MRNLPALLFSLLLWLASLPVLATEPLLVLSYHDIRDDVAGRGADADPYATSTDNFAAHLAWLTEQGYHPVSLQQVIDAGRRGAALPPKPVLLTFDDGLRSVYTRAFPLLRAYGYPAVAALVTSWVDLPGGRSIDYGHRPFTRDDFLTWEQVREMQDSGLVEFASHSHDLHRGIVGNPQGNLMPAAVTRAYDAAAGRYEPGEQYLARLRADLATSSRLIREHTGKAPRAMVWPYAAYSSSTDRIAESLGMEVSFYLKGRTTLLGPELHALARLLVSGNPEAEELANELQDKDVHAPIRALQVDLDAVYDADPAQQERNLDLLVEQIKRIAPSHVFLQAFADPDGNGSADALYFPNRFLPMRADLFSRVAWQLSTRAGVKVYGWLPVLGFEPADAGLRQRLAIKASAADEVFRLDFTQPEARKLVARIYEDLAAASYIEGLLFHDDAYLRDDELPGLNPGHSEARTRALVDFTLELRDAAQRWRPKLYTVRNLFARPVLQPDSVDWYAQRLDLFNAAYDFTALMAMPWMEQARKPRPWMDRLVAEVQRHDPGFNKTIFELQTVDWRSHRPIPGDTLHGMGRRLLAAGVRHLAWYPYDFIADRPTLPEARAAVSASGFPYEAR